MNTWLASQDTHCGTCIAARALRRPHYTLLRQPQPAAVDGRSSQKIAANRALLCDPRLQAPFRSKVQSLSWSKNPIQGVERWGYPQQGKMVKKYGFTPWNLTQIVCNFSLLMSGASLPRLMPRLTRTTSTESPQNFRTKSRTTSTTRNVKTSSFKFVSYV